VLGALFSLSCGNDVTPSEPTPTPPPPPQPTWHLEGQIVNDITLNDVAWVSSTEVFMVGDQGVLLHYDGVTLTKMPPPIEINYNGVWARSANDVYAVGTRGNVHHYNGNDWTRINTRPDVELFDIWGAPADTLYIAGDLGTMLRYDGTDFTEMDSDAPATIALRGVYGTAGNDIFAVGDLGNIVHFDGTDWSSQNSTVSNTLTAVWGSSADDYYATGTFGTMLHYDGAWSRIVSVPTNEFLTNAWGTGDDDVYLVGSRGIVLHYNGANWSFLDTPASESAIFYGIAGEMVSGGEKFIVGSSGNIFYTDNDQWTTLDGRAVRYSGVWGSGDSNIYTVGNAATVRNFNGTSWSFVPSVTTKAYTKVSGQSDQQAIVVGETGTAIEIPASGGMNDISSSFDGTLWDVWASDLDAAIAVGDAGAIWSYNGSSWNPMDSPVAERLTGVWGFSGKVTFLPWVPPPEPISFRLSSIGTARRGQRWAKKPVSRKVRRSTTCTAPPPTRCTWSAAVGRSSTTTASAGTPFTFPIGRSRSTSTSTRAGWRRTATCGRSGPKGLSCVWVSKTPVRKSAAPVTTALR
jgi:photosystem II stability/assembly factor-like uncharacterized protein